MPLPGLLVDAALLALIMVALGFALAGLMLWARPERFSAPDTGPGRWLLDPLETPRSIERFLYRHHRWFGAIVVAGAGFCLWRIGRTDLLWTPEIAGFRMTLLWILVIVCFLALLTGVAITLRPSGLKPIEARANRWIGWRDSAPQRWLKDHPRARGFLILLVSAYGLVVFTLLLVERVNRWPAHFP